MKSSQFLCISIPLVLFVNNVHCIRNLFLPRTGDIGGISSSVITENLSNVTNFEGLLGAGRSLAYPFAAGMLLTTATLASENNWKVSDEGFSKVLGIPREEIVDSYGTYLEMLETDENVTLSNTLFSFRTNFSPSEALAETLMTEVKEVTWTRETWKQTYQLMVEHLGNVTNEKIENLLIPPVTKIGTPFRKATQAVLLNTFHYINGWQYPWTDAEMGKFLENDGIPFLKVEGTFLVADEEEYMAVSVPLEGGSKSLVFVLPHANLTSKYFRNQADADDGGETDIVPFPKKWKSKTLRLKVPAFNTTDVDQYGQELEQIGMNETFCTIIRDYFGRFPYYLRPMVQVNFLDFNEDFLELASATGVAVEKFQSLFSIVGGGNDKDEKEDEKKSSIHQENQKNPTESLHPNATTKADVENGNGSNEKSNATNSLINSLLKNSTNADDGTNKNTLTLSLNRPFLWYLNDSEVGPIFFGTVENLLNLENADQPSDDSGNDDETVTTTISPSSGDDETVTTTISPSSGDEMNGNDNNSNGNGTNSNVEILSDIEKYYLWSCRSFTPTSAGVAHQKLTPSFENSFQESGDVPPGPPATAEENGIGTTQSNLIN